MRPRFLVLALLVATLGLSLAACGGDDEPAGDGAAEAPATTTATETETETEGETEDGGGEATKLDLAADPEGGLAFDKEELSAPAGAIVIELTNDAAIPHNVSVEGQTSETITDGAKTSLELELEAGEYEYICAVPGHAAAGMTGTLTVE